MSKEEKMTVEEVKRITALDVVYRILPCLSILLLFGLWYGVSVMYPHLFPSPGIAWKRFMTLLEKPIMRVSFWRR